MAGLHPQWRKGAKAERYSLAGDRLGKSKYAPVLRKYLRMETVWEGSWKVGWA